MRRDFSPRECWIANEATVNEHLPYGLWLANISEITNDNISKPYFTEEELEDRRKHRFIAVTGMEIYNCLRDYLSDEHFKELNKEIGDLINADLNNGDISKFPEALTDWYFNRKSAYYREPNDENFVDYITEKYPMMIKITKDILKYCKLQEVNTAAGFIDGYFSIEPKVFSGLKASRILNDIEGVMDSPAIAGADLNYFYNEWTGELSVNVLFSFYDIFDVDGEPDSTIFDPYDAIVDEPAKDIILEAIRKITKEEK